MKLLVTSAVAIILALAVSTTPAPAPGRPPAARRIDFTETLHGVELHDPYHWLEDFADPAAAAWIEAQDRHARAFLSSLPGQDRLRQRYAGLLQVERLSVPEVVAGRYFYTKTPPDKPQPLLCLRRGAGGAEEVWLDPAMFGDASVAAATLGISPDGKAAAYSVRRSGQDEVEVRLRDIDGAKDLPDRLPKALYGSVAFRKDGSGFYYARRARESGSRIWFHRMGAARSADTEVFGQGMDARVFLSPEITTDGRWLLVHAGYGWARTEIWFRDLAKNEEPLRLLTAGMESQFSAVEAGPGKVLLVTAWNAPRKRALLVDLERPAPGNWREVIPEAADSLEHATVAGGRIYAGYLHDVQSRIRIFSLDGKPLGEVPLPEGSSARLEGRWDQPEAFLAWASFLAPARIERLQTTDGGRISWFEPRVEVPPDLEVRQVWYASKDGTRVPMYLIHRKGLTLDGNRPVLLTGYGGFNVAMLPGFNADAVIWAEAGGVWARPNLRGGAEFGEDWHRAGMLERKQNVFDDFLGAAEWLIANRYTNPTRLAISGRSNGGLLMGAALTQRPDLFRAVYCGYPDLDMVRYYRYTKNNNAPALLEYGDGGNPRHFAFLRSWSPYERVEAGKKYPAILFATGEGDTRVPPQQAVKMAAKVEWATRSGLPVLLRFDRKSGHAGGRTLAESIADNTAEQAFLLHELGVAVPSRAGNP
jgi:prolyl oligopeptidase